MDMNVSRLNMYTFPVFVSLFEDYPLLREVQVRSGWVHGYFGSSFEERVVLLGDNLRVPVVSRHFNNFVYRGIEHPFLMKDLKQFKQKEKK